MSVGGVILESSVLLAAAAEEDGQTLSFHPSAQSLLRTLRHSNLRLLTLLESLAMQYSCDCFLLDTSSSSVDASALNRITQAWSSTEGGTPRVLFLAASNNITPNILDQLSNLGWLLVLMGVQVAAASHNPNVLHIGALQELLFTIASSNKKASGGNLLTVGYVMKPSREDDFAKRGAFPVYPTPNGLMFLPLKFELPLLSQLQKVDILLHKATDEIISVELNGSSESSNRITYTAGMQELKSYMEHHSDVFAIDSIDKIYPMLDRLKIQQILLGLEDLNKGGNRIVRGPHFLQVTDFNAPDLGQKLSEAGLSLPSIVKPQVACGVADAHSMAIVFRVEDFKDLSVPVPAVIQEYVDHSCTLFKIYVLGGKVFYAVKRSTPNANILIKLSEGNGLRPLLFDSLKSLPTATGTDGDPFQSGSDNFDLGLVTVAANWLARKLELTIQEGSRDHVIVDVNYLPSFKEVPDDVAIPAFWDAIKQKDSLTTENKRQAGWLNMRRHMKIYKQQGQHGPRDVTKPQEKPYKIDIERMDKVVVEEESSAAAAAAPDSVDQKSQSSSDPSLSRNVSFSKLNARAPEFVPTRPQQATPAAAAPPPPPPPPRLAVIPPPPPPGAMMPLYPPPPFHHVPHHHPIHGHVIPVPHPHHHPQQQYVPARNHHHHHHHNNHHHHSNSNSNSNNNHHHRHHGQNSSQHYVPVQHQGNNHGNHHHHSHGHGHHHPPPKKTVAEDDVDDLTPSDPSPKTDSAALQDEAANKLLNQVEYYFSDINLATTDHLIRFINKDPQGYVPISVVASFKKIKAAINSNSQLATILRNSSKLEVSEDGKRVRRLHPLTESDVEELQSRVVVAENLPEDHCHQNLMKIFSAIGSVKTIRTCPPQTTAGGTVSASRSAKTDGMHFSNKLHAFVEYESVEMAEKAVAELNNEGNWRSGLRVRLMLKRTLKPNQPRGKKGHDGQAHSDEDEVSTSEQLPNEKQMEEHPQQHDVHSHEHSAEDHGNDKEGAQRKGRNKGRGKGRGRAQYHHNNRGNHVGTPPSNNPVIGEQPMVARQPPGPRMPDGTRGFAMGRGKPVAVSNA
ncbi:hypothetical protein Tsubulata_001249 [Turnera subulata]|uniref:inositol-1,3,4-trisphosphate 5/6-kinase n=1 Tax=Turnera subulata TaxID=218843 RepID=A0A9Q0FNG3_9ROSI|nr:hypothetical protein Tsubulata_001249 [Turnera subulata]